MKVHHIGYAVKNIDKAMPQFERLGYTFGDITDDEIRKVKITFGKNGDECVELIAPNGEGADVGNVIVKNGPTPYHICYEVESIEQTVEDLKQGGWMVVKKPEVAPAINNRRVAFLYQKDVGMIELVEG